MVEQYMNILKNFPRNLMKTFLKPETASFNG